MFSVTTGEQTRVLQAHESNVVGVAINPANPLQLYSFGRDRRIYLWDYNDAIILRRFKLPMAVEHFAFAPGRSDIVYLAAFGSRVKNGATMPSYDVYEFSLDASNAFEDPADLPASARAARPNGATHTKAPTKLLQMKARTRSSFLVTPDGEYLIVQSKRHFKVFHIASGVIKKFKQRNNISCIAVHPKQHFVAIGDDAGEIIFWYVFSHAADVSDGSTAKLARTSSKGSMKAGKTKEASHDEPITGGSRIRDDPVTTTVHWHAHRVGAITFDSSGAHMYSGGQEMVLVIWQLESGKKDWLPRLPAPIIGMSHTPDETLLAIRCSDNTIKLINSRSRLLQVAVEGVNLTTPYLDRSKLTGTPAAVQAALRQHNRSQRLMTGLVVEPRTQAFVFNATEGQLQFFSAQEDKHIYKLQVGPKNPVKSFQDTRIAETTVTHVAFSRSGDWMVTVEARDDMVGQTALKFWLWDKSTQQYELNTQYNVNKAERIRALAYHPKKERVTVASADGKFRIWSIRQNRQEAPANTTNANSNEGNTRKGTTAAHPARVEALEGVAKWRWVEEATASYRSLQPRAASYSADGSLLAIAYQHIITLWSPDTNTLLTTLTAPPDHEPVTKLSFLNDSHYLVACTKRRLFVWDLLTCQLKWTHVASIDTLTTDSRSSRFAIYAPHDLNTESVAPAKTSTEGSKSASVMDVDAEEDRAAAVARNAKAKALRQASLTTDGYVMLFSPESPSPLGFWVLPALGVRGISFLPSRASGKHSSHPSQDALVQSSLVYLNGQHEFKFLLSPEEASGDPSLAPLPLSSTQSSMPNNGNTSLQSNGTPSSPIKSKGKQQQQQLKNTLQLQQQFIAKLNATKLAEGPSVFTLMYGATTTSNDAFDGANAPTPPRPAMGGLALPKIATASKQKPLPKGAVAHNSTQAKMANTMTEQLLNSFFQSDVQVLPAPTTLFPQFADALIFKTTAKSSESESTEANKTTSGNASAPTTAPQKAAGETGRKNDDFKYVAPKKLAAARIARAELGAEAKLLESEVSALAIASQSPGPLSFMDDFFATLPTGKPLSNPMGTPSKATIQKASTKSTGGSGTPSSSVSSKGTVNMEDSAEDAQKSSKKRKRSKSITADEE